MTEPSILADVAALLEARCPSLVVLDSFTAALSLHGCDSNSGAEVERFYPLIVNSLRAQGAGVLLLDHVTKSKDTRGRFSIGSERKLAAADVHLSFEAVRPFGRGKSGLVKITTHKDRPGHLPRPRAAELELTSDPETGAITWQIRPAEHTDLHHSFRPTNLMEKVSSYVEVCAGDAPSRNNVEENVSGKRDFVRLAIDALLAEGYLDEKPGPRNARLLISARSYREADDPAS
jgi:hypothetical protein